jgi:hypothetical protein
MTIETEDILMPALEAKEITLCKAGAAYIEELIKAGKVNKTDAVRLTEIERKGMLGDKGGDYKLYAKHHLGEDLGKPEDTRMRFALPVVVDGVVHMRALMKACNHDNKEIRETARRLCKMGGLTEGKDIVRPTRNQFACPVMATGSSTPMNAAGRCRQLDAAKCKLKNDGDGDCNMMDGDAMACPMMKAGEGNPMDGWQGCAEYGDDGYCGLQSGVVKCNMVKDSEEE